MRVQVGEIQMNYELSGNPDGQIVALSHSLGSSGIMWNRQLPLLEPDYRVIRIDTRGHGRSSAPDGEYTMDQLVADVIGLLDTLEIDQFHWVGLSMGGMIGQGLGIFHPERLLSLCLCDTMSRVPEALLPVWEERVRICSEQGMEPMVASAMERWFTDNYRSGTLEPEYYQVQEQVRNTPLAGYIGCCHAIMKFDYLDQLQSIRTPTHIIVGDQDFATPVSESQAMHERIPNSSLEIIPGAAHFSNIEQSEIFDRSLMNFLKQH